MSNFEDEVGKFVVTKAVMSLMTLTIMIRDHIDFSKLLQEGVSMANQVATNHEKYPSLVATMYGYDREPLPPPTDEDSEKTRSRYRTRSIVPSPSYGSPKLGYVLPSAQPPSAQSKMPCAARNYLLRPVLLPQAQYKLRQISTSIRPVNLQPSTA